MYVLKFCLSVNTCVKQHHKYHFSLAITNSIIVTVSSKYQKLSFQILDFKKYPKRQYNSKHVVCTVTIYWSFCSFVFTCQFYLNQVWTIILITILEMFMLRILKLDHRFIVYSPQLRKRIIKSVEIQNKNAIVKLNSYN